MEIARRESQTYWQLWTGRDRRVADTQGEQVDGGFAPSRSAPAHRHSSKGDNPDRREGKLVGSVAERLLSD